MDVIFVCLGNICRSPAAEGVARALRDQFPQLNRLDSAGTGPWHAGEPPHTTMCQVARSSGMPIDDLRARQIRSADFHDFDWIVAMDRSNLRDLHEIHAKVGGKAKVVLLLSDANLETDEIPDPYGGSIDDFRHSFSLIQQGVQHRLLRIFGKP